MQMKAPPELQIRRRHFHFNWFHSPLQARSPTRLTTAHVTWTNHLSSFTYNSRWWHSLHLLITTLSPPFQVRLKPFITLKERLHTTVNDLTLIRLESHTLFVKGDVLLNRLKN